MGGHGQTGNSGFGISHGYGEGDAPDTDNSHEFKGHGVSADWITKAKGESGWAKWKAGKGKK